VRRRCTVLNIFHTVPNIFHTVQVCLLRLCTRISQCECARERAARSLKRTNALTYPYKHGDERHAVNQIKTALLVLTPIRTTPCHEANTAMADNAKMAEPVEHLSLKRTQFPAFLTLTASKKFPPISEGNRQTSCLTAMGNRRPKMQFPALLPKQTWKNFCRFPSEIGR
jgi:hypothetical protein